MSGNVEKNGGRPVVYGIECWKCNHFWWHPGTGETIPCPSCQAQNWTGPPDRIKGTQ